METVQGVLKKSLSFNAKTGYQTFYLKPKEGTCTDKINKVYGTIKCCGKLCVTQEYMPVILFGEWKEFNESSEFHFHEAKEFCDNIEDARMFLSSVTDLSALNATKIVSCTGYDIFNTVYVNGIEEKIQKETKINDVDVITAFTKIRKIVEELHLFKIFSKYDGNFEDVMKVVRKFEAESTSVLIRTPYRLMEAGIRFSLVDRIALDNNMDPLAEERIHAATANIIKLETAGNMYMDIDTICKKVNAMKLDIPKNAVIAALANHPTIVKETQYEEAYYEKNMLEDEKLAAKEFARLLKSSKRLPFHPEYIDIIEQENGGRKFGNQQRSAFQLLRSTGIKLLTGDPGTGKTTTVNGILRYIEMLWENEFKDKPKFALCAPSGRAAQRMKETTNRNAQTVHKLLEYQPYGKGEYYKDANDPIDANVIVVDEVSMLGLSTFSKLVAAIKNNSIVILVGDTNQLQSVEAGNVLEDIINSGVVDRCDLKEVFRQAKESLININAKKVIAGDYNLKEGPDFEIIKSPNAEATPDIVKQIAEQLIVEAGDKNRVQALAPMKKGTAGINEGNSFLQDLFNPMNKNMPFKKYGTTAFRLHDRIIMMTNNYASGYYNGDVGYINFIRDDEIDVKIGEEVIKVRQDQFSDMNLAYNCTIHKSQGSEYDYLILILQESMEKMLNRNLLYTGITRGKKKVVIVYEGDSIHKSCAKEKEPRKSLLIRRIRTELGFED